jgi:hypothetical protein
MIFYLFEWMNFYVEPASFTEDFWASNDSFLISYLSIEISILEFPFSGSRFFWVGLSELPQ